MIEFPCPNCEGVVRVDDSLAGALGRCPHCRREIHVPSAHAAVITLPHYASAGGGSDADLERLEIDPDKPPPRPIVLDHEDSDSEADDEERVALRQQWPGILLGFFVGFTVAVVIGGIVYTQREAKLGASAAEPHNPHVAYLASQRFVLETTKVTDIVSFPWRGYEVKYIGSGQYIVRSDYVVRDFEGVTTYMEYSCLMSYLDNRNWICNDLIYGPKQTEGEE